MKNTGCVQSLCQKHCPEHKDIGRGNKIPLKTWLFVAKQQSELTCFCPGEESEVPPQVSLALFARVAHSACDWIGDCSVSW